MAGGATGAKPGGVEGDERRDQQAAADSAAGVPSDEVVGTARKRADLDRIFGDVLPDTTRDERGEEVRGGDDWYLSNRPPHHGG